ncbi:MAG: anti-sigma factor, partial [Chloroflexota bacterium]|nr:anti-sigma factor [Chloroflexota bacterium]
GYLIVQGLPAAPPGKTYQAWYLSRGEPRSVGLLTVGGDGLAILTGLRYDPAVDAIAVSLEDQGGAEKPTTQPLVYGNTG